MKIVQIAHVNVPVLAKTGGYGGLEEVVATLDREYTRLGHESYVVASTDSEATGTLLPTIESLYGPGRGHLKADHEHIAKGFDEHVKRALEHIRDIKPDVVHDHTGYHKDRSFAQRLFDSNFGLRREGEIAAEKMPPMLVTIHGYLTDENRGMYLDFQNLFKNRPIHFNAVSQFQRTIFRRVLDVDHVIHNAIDVDSYQFGEKGKGYVFSMGSIYPGKGTHIAVETALKTGKKLVLAGPYFHNKDYWDIQIKPFVDRTELKVQPNQLRGLLDDFVLSGDRVLYLGELGAREKRIVYTGSDAFYFPVTIDETFGLVSAESNASGVPVISFLSGGVPEVVRHGVTGYTVKRGDDGQFRQAALSVDNLSRNACRAWAKRNFDANRQAGEYLDVYESLIESDRKGDKGGIKRGPLYSSRSGTFATVGI